MSKIGNSDIEMLKNNEEDHVSKIWFLQDNLTDILYYFNKQNKLDEFCNIVQTVLQSNKCREIENIAFGKILEEKDEIIERLKKENEFKRYEVNKLSDRISELLYGGSEAGIKARDLMSSILRRILDQLVPDYRYRYYENKDVASGGLDLETISNELESIVDSYIINLKRKDSSILDYINTRNEIKDLLDSPDFKNDINFLRGVITMIKDQITEITRRSVVTKMSKDVKNWEEFEKKKLREEERKELIKRKEEATEEYERYLELREKFDPDVENMEKKKDGFLQGLLDDINKIVENTNRKDSK